MIYLELFLTFFKIGLFTFGGGYAMLPLVTEEVLSHDWLSGGLLVDFVAIAESTPGPFAINLATFVGTEVGGIFGAICSTIGAVLPSFIIILIVAKVYGAFQKSKAVRGVMSGLKPASVGLIASAVLTIGQSALFATGITVATFQTPALYISLGIFAVTAVMVFKKVHPIIVIVISALLGIAFGYIFAL